MMRNVGGASPAAVRLTGRRNAFGFIRTLLAVAVIVDHAYPLGGFGKDALSGVSRGQDTLGGLAVAGFFVISGFLVTRSFRSSRSTVAYLWRRCLRILPGFWVCLIVTAVVVGPLAWHREHGTIAGYVSPPAASPIGYIANNVLLDMRQWTIGGLLTHNPFPGVLDGSLWTLWYEFVCYLGIAALGVAGLLAARRIWLLVALATTAALSVLLQVAPGVLASVPLLHNQYNIRFAYLFLIGATLEVFGRLIPFDGRLAWFAMAVAGLTFMTGGWLSVGYLAYGYAIMFLAQRWDMSWWERRGDFSYGIYIYAFPVQQLLALWGAQRWGVGAYILLSVGLTLPVAIASWWLVERPALRLKNREPWRHAAVAWLPARVGRSRRLPAVE